MTPDRSRYASSFVALLLMTVCGAAAPPARALATPVPARVEGALARWPLDGAPAVVRPFSPPATPYGRGHRGVDLAAAPGVAVRAARAGVVSFAGVIAGRGVVVVAHAGGLRTTYEPVAATALPGLSVAMGAALGTLAAGHPGCTAPACLHWGLRRGADYLDPLSLLGLGRVRLLPLSTGARNISMRRAYVFMHADNDQSG
jgi:murein DD-endopeptidase MepM/ murein hydrolase activator NlpD